MTETWDDEHPEGGGREAFAVERIGHYRLIQRLGEGGMGVVHLALDRRGRAVAIKALRPHVAADPAARVRLAREVETLRRVDSPYVAPIVDADIAGEPPYVVTKYIPGYTLDEVVSEGGPLPPAELHQLAAGLAEALHAIHAAGVVHRDLKPTNILLVDGDPVLIDFGIAHLAGDSRLTQTGLVMGTPGYLAPELVEGGEVTAATDWWGWAATVTYAACGAPPFGRGAMDAVLARVMRGDPDLAAVDPRIAPLLGAALSPRPADRPHHDDIVRALRAYADGQAVTEAIELPGWSPAREPVSPPTVAPTAVLPTVLPSVRTLPPPPEPAPPRPAPAPMAPVGGPGPTLPPPVTAYGMEQVVSDPRIGRAEKSGTIAALTLAFCALGAVAPVIATAALAVHSVAARTVDRVITARLLRRHHRGEVGNEVARTVAASPWHLALAVGSSALALVIPVLVGGCALLLAALAFDQTSWPSVVRSLGALAVGAWFMAIVAWWGPGGVSLRRGTRSLARGAAGTGEPERGERAGQVVVGILVVLAVTLVVWGVLRGAPTWSPLPAAPDLLTPAKVTP
jgi:serine/threonine protein kinase